MGRTELGIGIVTSIFALAAMSCAATTSDDAPTPGAANAGSPGSAGAGVSGSSASAGTSASAGASAGAGTSATGGASASGGASAGAGAGAAGTAGASSSAGGCGLTPEDMISDFESGKAEVIVTGGRDGSWFLFNDGTGTQTPPKIPSTPLAAEPGGACNSMFAFHSTGSGFTVFGAGFGADFAPKVALAPDSTVYDASAYSGVALSVKSAAAISLRVSVSDVGTAPEGKVCVDTTDKTNKLRCGDYFGSDIVLGAAWQEFVLPFAAMKQRGFGLPIATGIDKSKVYTLRAQTKGSAAAPGAYDIWLDNVRFVK